MSKVKPKIKHVIHLEVKNIQGLNNIEVIILVTYHFKGSLSFLNETSIVVLFLTCICNTILVKFSTISSIHTHSN